MHCKILHKLVHIDKRFLSETSKQKDPSSALQHYPARSPGLSPEPTTANSPSIDLATWQ